VTAFDAAGWLRTRTVTRTVTREALARDDGAYDDDVREESLAEFSHGGVQPRRPLPIRKTVRLPDDRASERSATICENISRPTCRRVSARDYVALPRRGVRRRRSTQKRRFATNVRDRAHYGTRATRRKATEKTRKRTQRKGACNDASARARAFVGGADARRCVRRSNRAFEGRIARSRVARSRRRRACDSPRARAGGERRVNARITLRASARRARVARHPIDQSTRCRDAGKNAKKTLD